MRDNFGIINLDELLLYDLNEIKEKFGVNSLEELRNLRSELFAKNQEEINSLTEILNEREEEVRLAEEGINKAKNLIK